MYPLKTGPWKGCLATSSETTVFERTELVEAARLGDEAAFGELYRLLLGDIRDFCARRISDPFRAEDLAQETFLKAYESIGSFRSGHPFWPWLSTIARHLCIDELRQRGRAREGTAADPSEAPARDTPTDATADEALAQHTGEHIRAVLTSALERVSDRDRRMLWFRAVEEQSWEQIARANGTTVHSVRNSAWRARNRLRVLLGDTLRDLRSRVAIPLAFMASRWRRLRDRWRSRVGDDYGFAFGILVDRGTSLLVGLTVLSVAFLHDPSSQTSQRPDRRPLALEASLNDGLGTPPIAAQPEAVEAAKLTKTGLGPVDTTVATGSRDKAAVPAATAYRIEAHGPDGKVLYWEETTITCGDGAESAPVPPASPIQAYC
ncbi:MAG: RNA polymerase sigma factor [Actinomycetota bacterium]